MLKGSAKRVATQPVDALFIDRWSPRAMSGEALSEPELLKLFEAARWAPSCGNFQPWRFLYARRDTDFWPAFLELLSPKNRSWAQRAGALVLVISRTHFDGDGRACATHSFDAGAAWQNLALQAWLGELVAHAIAGFDAERARRVLRVPAAYAIEAMIVLGRRGDPALLDDALRQREVPSDRRPLAASVCEGPFNL
ncbi:MAG: nitroreductase family protein [Gammaproteobacteria bacterium]|nr:nitroreductase family protein [Gammaproteobacteria bacterium]MDE2250672.1 nitroreductase family protein [Gammaproteobacteria bacterium]